MMQVTREISNYKQIDEHYVLAASDVVCFTEDTASTIADFFTHDSVKLVQMDLPSFPNDSATIYLLTPDSNIVDKFSYSDDMHFELINDPEGVSLEKIISSENSNEFQIGLVPLNPLVGGLLEWKILSDLIS